MRIHGVAGAAAVLVVSIWTSAIWAQAQTDTRSHGHDQASPAQGMQPPKTVLKQVTDTIGKMPQHEVRVVTATLPAGVTGGWHKHSAPVYVYLSEGVATLELDDGTMHHFETGEVVVEPADTRAEICAALDALADKREQIQPRKHGNSPL